MYPELLCAGDQVRIIAPSRSLSIIDDAVVDLAVRRLTQLGLRVTFGEHVREILPYYHCGSLESRLADLHQAFVDGDVKAILTVVGGYNSNQLLPYINYGLIRDNPKIFCGLSDITALQNAIFSRTGLVTFSGPHFSSFGMKQGFAYTQSYFERIFFRQEDRFPVEPSDKFSSDVWHLCQDSRMFQANSGMIPIQPGSAEGRIIGGNLCTLNLLLGTEYMPSLQDTVLFLEDTCGLHSNFLLEFDRNLEALTQQPDFPGVRGLVFGRPEDGGEMTVEKWRLLIQGKPALKDIPILIHANFGHTTPIFTFPIGGYCRMELGETVRLEIRKHG